MTPYRHPSRPIEPAQKDRLPAHQRPLTRAQGQLAIAIQGAPLLLLATAAVVFLVFESVQLLAGILVALIVAMAIMLWQRFRVAEWSAALSHANKLLARGEAEKAALLLDKLARDAQTSPAFHACTLVVLALAWLRLADRERALALLQAADESTWLDGERTRAWRVVMLGALATVCALDGNLDAGEAYRDRARTSARSEDRPSWIVAHAMLEVMRGRDAAFVAEMEADSALHGLGDTQANVLRIIHAFSLDRMGRGEESKRVLSGARAPRSDETRLLDDWAELGEFARRRLLVT
jgi:hypothetical protein